jgi:iron(III) transport system substrate-binding protein
MRPRKQSIGLLVMVALIVSTTARVFAAPVPTPTPLAKVIEQAKKEGNLTVYASYSYEEANEIHAAFNKRYPFIKFEHLSLGSGDVVTRILMESKSGTAGADVGLTGATTFLPLVKEGFLREVDWAALGVYPNAIDSPRTVICATVTYVLAWNTQLVTRAEAPKNWNDLLNPKWKGKVGVWISPYAFAEIVPALGEPQVTDYLKKLLQNDPVIIRAGAEMPSRVAAGEVSVAVVIDETLRRVVGKGGPIDWTWPDPVAITPYGAAIPKSARNPNAATLYCTWLASPEGSAVYEKASGRGNVFIPDSSIAQKTKGKKYSYWRTEQAGEKAAVIKRFTAMIAP